MTTILIINKKGNKLPKCMTCKGKGILKGRRRYGNRKCRECGGCGKTRKIYRDLHWYKNLMQEIG